MKEIFQVSSIGSKNLLIFICHFMKFHNCDHTTLQFKRVWKISNHKIYLFVVTVILVTQFKNLNALIKAYIMMYPNELMSWTNFYSSPSTESEPPKIRIIAVSMQGFSWPNFYSQCAEGNLNKFAKTLNKTYAESNSMLQSWFDRRT